MRSEAKKSVGSGKFAKQTCEQISDAKRTILQGTLKIEQHNERKPLKITLREYSKKVIKSSKDLKMQHVSDSGNRIEY